MARAARTLGTPMGIMVTGPARAAAARGADASGANAAASCAPAMRSAITPRECIV